MRIRRRKDYRSRITDGRLHSSIPADREIFVIGVDDQCYRIIDICGEPILFPKKLFDVIDATVPSGWSFQEYEDLEFHLEPIATSRPGFFEDWHGSDGDVAARDRAHRVLREELARMATEANAGDRVAISEALSLLSEWSDRGVAVTPD